MPEFRIPLVTNEYYHVFNRGVARQPTFLSKNDYEQALLALSYYRFSNPPMRLSRYKELSVEERSTTLSELQENEKRVEIISFVFMPNHFHMLLKQTAENGISSFISQFSNSYTRYFNTKYNRVGPIFQGVFKSVHVESTEQLVHLSRYIHLNPVVSAVIRENDLSTYRWSSLPDYLEEKNFSIIYSEPILEQFSSRKEYLNFVSDHVGYASELEQVKHLTLED